jgi:hypothetical protein
MSDQEMAHDGSTGLCTRPGDNTIVLYTLAGNGSTGELAKSSATGASANISANISAGIGADLGTGIGDDLSVERDTTGPCFATRPSGDAVRKPEKPDGLRSRN